MADAPYALYYWPGIPGRGEFVRLVLEQAGAAYDDVARRPKEDGGGIPAMMRCLAGEGPGLRPLAPPVLVHGERRLAQMPNVCAYLAARHGLVPSDEGTRAEALQLQLTVADLVAETHDTHHPVGKGLYYEEQKEQALAYDKNPVDNLAPLAKAGVPLLHVFGDADEVVPWEENTKLIADRYRALGGDIQLIRKPGIGHHPHGLKDSTPIVDFILRHAMGQQEK